jgi:multidrug resistance efflux pump
LENGFVARDRPLKLIHEGQSAMIWLLGYTEMLQGHVDIVARGIVVSNATPGKSGFAPVNPIFTWVRLAQRVPGRVHIDRIPSDVRLGVGMNERALAPQASSSLGAASTDRR